MTKEEAENFVYKCLVDNESKKDPKDSTRSRPFSTILKIFLEANMHMNG